MNEDTLGSIWCKEFCEQRDVDYAILNLSVDLRVYTIHMLDIAKRMQGHFPEITDRLIDTAKVLDDARAKMIGKDYLSKR